MSADRLTIKGRIEELQRAVVLMGSCVSAIDSEKDDVRDNIAREAILNAIRKTASDAAGHLYWLSCLPDLVLTVPAPTDDEAREETGLKDNAAARLQMTEAAVRRILSGDVS